MKFIDVPRFEEFAVPKLWKEVRRDVELGLYFPDYPKHVYPSREFFFNVSCYFRANASSYLDSNTIYPEVLPDFIERAWRWRRDKRLRTRFDRTIEVDEELTALIESTTAFSRKLISLFKPNHTLT